MNEYLKKQLHLKYIDEVRTKRQEIEINALEGEKIEREKFMEFLIENGIADDCVIDKDSYSTLPCIVGCFKKIEYIDNLLFPVYDPLDREKILYYEEGKTTSTFIVYETDEKAQIYGEKTFNSQTTAYYYLAQRFGKNYFDWIVSKRPRGMTKKMLEEIRVKPIVETHSTYDPPKYFTQDVRWCPEGPARLRYFAAIHSKTYTESLQDKQKQSECDSKSDIKKLVLHKK